MNLKEAEKKWRESCPDEVDGYRMSKKRKKVYDKIVKSALNRKKLKEQK
tara:strand:- start:746 stop:892 length:147 start_codon:yes stop_codon:yes gene_type:complete